jgi:hypothetical protein
MRETVKRIELPSGGWWDIETRPRWKHVHECENVTEWDSLKQIIAKLSTAWSFQESICPESIALRSEDDIAAMLEAFARNVSSLALDDNPVQLAEELFAGLVTGHVPDHFADVHIMAATGWDWHTLQNTPADVVQRMMIYLAVRQARDSQGAIDFIDEKEITDAR